MNTFWLDLRWTARTITSRPAVPLATIAILAVAIGAATILAVGFATVLDLPPVDAPEAVGRLALVDDTRPSGRREASVDDFVAWEHASRTLSSLTALATKQGIVGNADAFPATLLFVTENYSSLTRATPTIGEALFAGRDRRSDAVVISDRFWHERLDGAPNVLGREISIDAEPHVIVGVMPAGFWFPDRGVDIWLPFHIDRATGPVDIAGRLAAGATWQMAAAEFEVLAQQTGSSGPSDIQPRRVLVRSLESEARRRIGTGVVGFLAPALALLLLACANAGNLLLMRTIGRERELAIRAALGASGTRLARLAVAETAILAACGGLAGLLLARWGTTLLRTAVAAVHPEIAESIHGGSPAVIAVVLATALTLVGTAVLPVLAVARANLSAALAGSNRWRLFDRLRYNATDLLVALQVAVATTLVLVVAFQARFLMEFARVLRQPVPDDAVAVRLITAPSMTARTRAETYRHALDAATTIRGVGTAALASKLPGLSPGADSTTTTAGNAPRACRANVSTVTPGFFDALNLKVQRGRVAPAAGAATAVVSASAVERCFPESGSDWRAFVSGGASGPAWLDVTGVVADLYPASLLTPAPRQSFLWIVDPTDWPQAVYLIVRPAIGVPLKFTAVTEAIRNATSGVVMDAPKPLGQLLSGDIGGARLGVGLISVVAALALLLAFSGVYAALHQSCARRTRELGVRIALGSGRVRLVGAALARDTPLVVSGIVVGGIATISVTRATWPELLLLGALDVRVWIGVAGVLGVAALLASLGPIARTLRIDPVAVLRAE